MTAPASSGRTSLDGLRVLVLEDETLVSMMVEDMLGDLNCEAVGPFAQLSQAISHVEEGGEIDVALLDVNLGREQSFPLAAILAERGVPFIFTTGYDDSGIPEQWRGRPSLRKPFMLNHLTDALKKAVA